MPSRIVATLQRHIDSMHNKPIIIIVTISIIGPGPVDGDAWRPPLLGAFNSIDIFIETMLCGGVGVCISFPHWARLCDHYPSTLRRALWLPGAAAAAAALRIYCSAYNAGRPLQTVASSPLNHSRNAIYNQPRVRSQHSNNPHSTRIACKRMIHLFP